MSGGVPEREDYLIPSGASAPAAVGTAPAESPPQTQQRVVVFVVLWLVGVVVLAVMSFFAAQYPTFPGDVGLEGWVQQLQQPALADVINFASLANLPLYASITALLVIVVLVLLRQFSAAVGAILASFGADAVNIALNLLVHQPRPRATPPSQFFLGLGAYSFPSGHVTHVVAFYGFLLYLIWRAGRAAPRWRLWLVPVQALSLYFLLFVGPSRVLEGAHWPSDVLASYVLGSLMLVLAIVVTCLLERRWRRAERHEEAQRRLGVSVSAGRLHAAEDAPEGQVVGGFERARDDKGQPQ
jgi:membrane-associated phospholipid phosphatase